MDVNAAWPACVPNIGGGGGYIQQWTSFGWYYDDDDHDEHVSSKAVFLLSFSPKLKLAEDTVQVPIP